MMRKSSIFTSLSRAFARASLSQKIMLSVGAGISILFILTSLLAPIIAPFGFSQIRGEDGLFGSLQAPSQKHIWGTTFTGSDVFSRVIWGSQTALIVICVSILLSLTIGVFLGLYSGYRGGWLDRFLVMLADAIYSFPSLLIAILVSIMISGGKSDFISGILSASCAITVVFVPQYFRIVRSEVLRIKQEPFVDAARLMGSSPTKIIFRHILPNSLRTVPTIITLNASDAMLTLAGLGFIGFGIEPTSAAEWGYDLNKAVADVTSGVWWSAVFPGIAIILAVLGLTLLGEGLNDILDPQITSSGATGKSLAILHPESNAPAQTIAPNADTSMQVRNLKIDFPNNKGALKGISFNLPQNSILAIVGESGSGKTLLASCCLGLLPARSTVRGEILIRTNTKDAENLQNAYIDILAASAKEQRQIRGTRIAMVFQEPSSVLNPVFTVGWQLQEGLFAHQNISKKEARARSIEYLEKVGIPNASKKIDAYPHEFSGGQKQRIVIAMALALGAKILVADEPTTALDVTIQSEILELLKSIQKQYNTSIIIITHNMSVVKAIADEIIVMQNGSIVEQNAAHLLLQSPKEPYTKQLLSATFINKETLLESTEHNRQILQNIKQVHTSQSANHAHKTPVVSAMDLTIKYRANAYSASKGSFLAVSSASFSINRGEVLGLVGESGSGKSTIARCVSGLMPSSSGQLDVLGIDLSAHSKSHIPHKIRRQLGKKLGFVFQDPAMSFNPQKNIFKNIAEPLLVHSWGTHRQIYSRVIDLLAYVGIDKSLAWRFPHELSGGQKQRASMARALALEPELLICDEPTSALDAVVQLKVLELFFYLQKELGFACLFISHDLAVIGAVSDNIAVMKSGKIVEYADANTILKNPKHPYTQKLINSSL